MLTDKSVTIRYRTNQAIISEIQLSSDGKTFNRTKKSSQSNTEHLILIDSLSASSKYFYRIRLTSTQFAGDSTYFFKTAPTIGSQEKFSVWSIGDMWPEGPYQKNVYEGFKKFIAGPFAPEFLEYLRSQGRAGLKLINGGLEKVKAAYANYQKSKILNSQSRPRAEVLHSFI
jgi:hypothetical protein